MADYRSIHNHIWEDSWFSNLSTEAKLLWIYLITNRRASLSGIYEIQLRFIVFESGINEARVTEILIEFQHSGKLIYVDDILWIYKLREYQSNNSPKLRKFIEQDIKKIRQGVVLSAYCKHYGYPIDTVLTQSENDLQGYPMDTLSIGYAESKDTVSIPHQELGDDLNQQSMDTPSIPYGYPIDTVSDNINLNINKTKQNMNLNETTNNSPSPLQGEVVVVDFSNFKNGEVAQYFLETMLLKGVKPTERDYQILQDTVTRYGTAITNDAIYALRIAEDIKSPLRYLTQTAIAMSKDDAAKAKAADDDSEPVPYYPTVEELEEDRKDYMARQGLPLEGPILTKEQIQELRKKNTPEIFKRMERGRDA